MLGLPKPSRTDRLLVPAAVALLAIVLGLAAAQPVLRTKRAQLSRLDAEAMFAVDISRSMAAARTAGSPTRLDRAREIVARVRAAIPEIPTGIGTFTDRPLPILLPTSDLEAFAAAAEKAIDIERPPALGTGTTISSFDAVGPFPGEGYFSPSATKRLLIVLTDAESEGFNAPGIRTSFQAKPRTAVVLIRMGSTGERVFGPDGRPESEYIPPPATGETLAQFLAATHGQAFDEHEVAGAVSAARDALGTGPAARVGTVSARHDLAPWLVLAGIVPLGLVLRRRNLSGRIRGGAPALSR